MTQLSLALKTLARELESDPDIVRVKKLLLLACTGHWESDDHKIDLLDPLRLIQRLQLVATNYERLDMRLRRAAAYLNKPLVYGAIADRLSARLAELYEINDEESTLGTDHLMPPPPPPVLLPTVTGGEERTLLAVGGGPPPPLDMNVVNELENVDRPRTLASCNWFALRYDIVRTTNPLRVKILSFFTLEPQNSFNAYTWATIKAELLDRLLFRLCEAYPALGDLDAQLRNTVNRFPETEDYAQAAEATSRALDRWIYSAKPEEDDEQGEAFSATGRLPEFSATDDEPTFNDNGRGNGYDDDDDDDDQDPAKATIVTAGFAGEEDDDGVERSMFAVENIFVRPSLRG